MTAAIDPERFSSFLMHLYRAAREVPAPDFQDAVLAQLKPLFGFDSSMWGTGTLRDPQVEVQAMHLHEQPHEMISSWAEANHEDTVVSLVTRNAGWVANVHPRTFFGGQPGKAGILEHARRFGAGNGLVTVHAHAGAQMLSWVSLYRRDPDAHYTEQQQLLLEALFPHVVEALAVNRLLHLDHVYMTKSTGRPAAAIADAKGSLHTTHGAFDELMATEWPDWSGKDLPWPVRDSLAVDARFRGSRIVLLWERVGDLFFMKARRLERVDLLSLRERQVAQLFAEGKSHKEIARLLQLAPATIRNVIQAAYAKLEVRGKAEMATLLARAG